MLLVLITMKMLVRNGVVFVTFQACVVASGIWFFPYFAFSLDLSRWDLDKQTTIELIQDKSIIK